MHPLYYFRRATTVSIEPKSQSLVGTHYSTIAVQAQPTRKQMNNSKILIPYNTPRDLFLGPCDRTLDTGGASAFASSPARYPAIGHYAPHRICGKLACL